MELKHYVTMMLICSYFMKWNNYDSGALMWSEWNISNRYRIIIVKIERFIFERIGIIRSLDPAVI